MSGKIDWEDQIGRRLRFRDLHVFFTVVRHGSMAKAATQLGVTPPTISEVIADLEHAVGVRLLERGPKGAILTVYGQAFLTRGKAAFEELKQGIRDIEFLSDPAVGEVRLGCDESIAAATLPLIIERFARKYPHVVLNVEDLDLRSPPNLRELGFDLVLTRSRGQIEESNPFNDLDVEVLFDDRLVVVAGTQSRWAHRRKVDIADLVNESWILTEPNTWNYRVVMEAFRKRRAPMPKVCLKTLSVHLRANLVASSGQFITAFPNSVLDLYGGRFGLKALPIELPPDPWPVILMTLKHRTLSPVVTAFIDCARTVTKSLTILKSNRN